MSRVIKFRAWLYTQMVYQDELIEQAGMRPFFASIEFLFRHVGTDRLMQFTGLHDKNGKEIYEGDVVVQEKWVSVGKYVPAKGVVKYKCVGFTCECIGDWKGSNATLNGNAQVIGNLYENPELLQEKGGEG